MALDKSLIGTEIELNGQTFLVSGTQARSYILEKDGKQYKATPDKINKIKAYNAAKAQTANSTFPHLERRLRYKQIFNKLAKLPTTEAECLEWFDSLTAELSPENLSCDGEASRGQINAKIKDIKGAWKELEGICGRKVSQEEIEEAQIQKIRAMVRNG